MYRRRLCQLAEVDLNGWPLPGPRSFRVFVGQTKYGGIIEGGGGPLVPFLPALGELSFGDSLGHRLNWWDRLCNPVGVMLATPVAVYYPFLEDYFYSQAEVSMCGAAAALRLYAKDNGDLPLSLDGLCPDYVQQVPLDPYMRDTPVGYSRIDGGCVLRCKSSVHWAWPYDLTHRLQFPELAAEVKP
jgi:hypothetical protein